MSSWININIICKVCHIILFVKLVNLNIAFVDINECTLNKDNCHVDASCRNTKGSFVCECNHGYSGNGTFCEGFVYILYFWMYQLALLVNLLYILKLFIHQNLEVLFIITIKECSRNIKYMKLNKCYDVSICIINIIILRCFILKAVIAQLALSQKLMSKAVSIFLPIYWNRRVQRDAFNIQVFLETEHSQVGLL